MAKEPQSISDKLSCGKPRSVLLLRQRAMHAWDITVFDDYLAFARNERLRRYVHDVRAPLRDHAEAVPRGSNRRGIAADRYANPIRTKQQ